MKLSGISKDAHKHGHTYRVYIPAQDVPTLEQAALRVESVKQRRVEDFIADIVAHYCEVVRGEKEWGKE